MESPTWPGTFGDVGPEGEVSALLLTPPEGRGRVTLAPAPRAEAPRPLKRSLRHIYGISEHSCAHLTAFIAVWSSLSRCMQRNAARSFIRSVTSHRPVRSTVRWRLAV